MPAGVVSVGVMADFLSVIEQSDQAGLSVEAFSGKVVTSTRDASRAWADYAKNAKLSADVAASAAAKVAEAADAAFGSLDASSKAQGNAAMLAARAAGASADEQSAAYAKAAAAARDAQVVQKAAADAQVANAEKAAAAAKAMADAQAEAAAKADLLTSHLSGLGEKTAGVAAEISKLGGVGFAASIAGMGDLAAKYQQATESIAANSGISSKAAAQIGAAFLGTSGKTIYSAKDMTVAFAAVAGQLKSTEGQALNSAQALKVMSAAGDLAEATNTDLTSATGALAMVMQGYHLSVGQASQASDLLFNTSRALNQPLGTVAQAINRLHGRLGDLAPSLGDIGGLMVELGSHGVQGSRGVSVVNTAFQTLVGDSQPVQQMLDTLGVKIFNSQGKFVGLQNVIAQLQPKFAGLTQQAQDLASKTLFGSSASQVMLSIVQRGPKAFEKSTTAAQQLGTAHAAATDQSKTLGKQLDILKASVENDATSIGLKLLPSLISMTHGLEDGVTWLEKHKTATEALGIAIGTVLAGAVTVFAYQKAAAFVTGLQDMVSGMGKLVSGIGSGASAISSSLSGMTSDSAASASAVEGSNTALASSSATTASAIAGTNAALETSNADAAASFEALTTKTAAAGAALDDDWAATAARVEATNEAIQASNAETAASFDGVAEGAAAAGAGGVAAGGAAGVATAGLAAAFGGFLLATKIPKGSNPMSAAEKAGQYDPYGPNTSPVPKPGQAQYVSPDAKTATKASIDALAELRKQIAAIKDPADLSSKQLNKLYTEAEHLAGMKGVTAKQHAAITKLEGSIGTARYSSTGPVDYKTSEFPKAENQFIQSLAKQLNFSPAVIAGWANSEQPPGQPANAANPYNYLNIGESGSGYRGSATNIWSSSPTTAASAAAQWIKTGQGVPGWASSGIGTIKAAGGTSIAQQIQAIQNSGWVGGPGGGLSYPNLPGAVSAVAGKGVDVLGTASGSVPTTGATGSKSLSNAVLNIGSGGTLPAVMQASSATSQATQLSDQANKAQAVGQAQVTELQAINQQLQDKGTAIVQQLTNTQARATDHSAAQVTALKDQTAKTTDQSTEIVTALKDSQQAATDKATEQVTAMKAQQTINDQNSAILVAKIGDATTAINDASAVTVAAINAGASRISDADNAQATLITDNAQTVADTLGERGLYGLNLVAQQDQVIADNVKAGFDQQIAAAQSNLDIAQGNANIANATAQQNTDQVTAVQSLLELAAQQNVNTVTQTQDALEAKAQQHLDAVTTKQATLEAKAQQHLDSVTLSQDAKEAKAQYHADSVTLKEDAIANAAKAHADAVTVSQDSRILKATQHADNVQLSVDVTKIGPAQTWADMQAGASKAAQTQAQNALNLATAQGSVTTGAANDQLALVTASANTNIATAENQSQSAQNAANTAIQTATDQYQQAMNQGNMAIQVATGQYQQSQNTANQAIQNATDQYQTAENTANLAIQNATDNYQTVQDTANQAIANATQTAAQTAANWATQLAKDQANLSGIQGQAAVGEATAQGNVTIEQALASTQFAGSGLQVNIYGYSANDAAQIGTEASWAIRTAGIATA